MDVLLFSGKAEPRCCDIIYGPYVLSLLRKFEESIDIASSSKVKYIGIFKSFIAINSSSPESCGVLSNTELVTRKFKVKDVYLQIDTILCGLKKSIPVEHARQKIKKSILLITQDEIDEFFVHTDFLF